MNESSKTRLQFAGIIVGVLTLFAAALVIPEVRVFLGLEEPQKVSSVDDASPRFSVAGPKKIEVDTVLKWRPNGRFGISFKVLIRNDGKTMSKGTKVRIVCSSLDHEQKRNVSYDNGYMYEAAGKQFDGLASGEVRTGSFVYWLDEDITAPPVGIHPFKIVAYSGPEGGVRSELVFEVDVKALPKIEIQG